MCHDDLKDLFQPKEFYDSVIPTQNTYESTDNSFQINVKLCTYY